MISALRARAILTMTVLLVLAGCGGGTSGEVFEVPHTIRFNSVAANGAGQVSAGTVSVDSMSPTSAAGPGRVKATAAIAADPVQVLRLVKVSETRISRLVYDYAFEPVVKTVSARADVTLRLTGAGVGSTIIDADSSAGSLPAAAELRLGDVVVLRVDRSKPFDSSALRWSTSSVPLPVGNTVTTEIFGWEFLEGEEGSIQRPMRVLAGGNRTKGLLLTPLRQSAPALTTLRWTIEDDALGAFSVTGTDLGPRLQVSVGAAPAGRTLTATLRGVDMATGTSIVRPVAADVLQPDGSVTAAIGATGGSIATPFGDVEFLPNGLTEGIGVTLVWKSAAREGAQLDVRFDRDIGYANVKFKLPALPEVDALPYAGEAPSSVAASAAAAGLKTSRRKAMQAAANGDACAVSSGGFWNSGGQLSEDLLARNSYFVAGMRVKEGSALAASNLQGKVNAYSVGGSRLRNVTITVEQSSVLQGSLKAAASCATRTDQLLQKYDWRESEPVLFIHGFKPGDKIGGGNGTWDRFPALAAGVSSPTGKALVPFEFRWRTNADFRTVASDLGRAINFLSQNSGGKKVHIVAHSFGGVLARSLLQGLAYDVRSDPHGKMQPAIDAVDSFTSFGSPYSGIFAVPTRVTGASVDAYLPRGRDDWTINACGQISCAQMGEDVGAFVDYAPGLGFSGDELIVGSHAALISQSSSRLPAIPVHVGIGLYRTNGVVQQGDNLISFAGQRFMNYSSNGAASDAALLEAEHVRGGAAVVTETILGELSTTRPGTSTPSPVVGSRANGYIHTGAGYRDGGTIWHHGLEAAVSEGCESVQNCKHDSFLLFRRAMNDLIGIGPSVPPQPMLPAQRLQVNPAVVGRLSANEVGQVLQVLGQIQAGGYVSGNQVRWDLVPIDKASDWNLLLQRMKGLELTPTQEAQIQQRKAELKQRLAVIATFGDTYIRNQNGWFVWDDTNATAFRDILKESVLGGYAAAQFAFADAFTVVDSAIGQIDLSDAQLRAVVRVKAAFERLKFEELAHMATDCADALRAFGATSAPKKGAAFDAGTFSDKLLPAVKCVAGALADFGNMDSDTARAWTKVLAASMDLGDGIQENLFTVVLDSGSAMVELLPATPATTRSKAVLDFLSSGYKAYRTGVELASHNNAIFLDRIADAASLIHELQGTEERLSNQRILAIRARDLFVSAPAVDIGQIAKPTGVVQANTVSTWTIGSLVATAVDVVWHFGSDVRQVLSTVSNQVSAAVDYVFQATGLQTVVATVKDAAGRLIGLATTQVDVQPGPVVTNVSPLEATAGVATTFVVTGSNLPEGLSFQLEGCGTVSELTAGSSDAMRQFSCTVPGSAAAGMMAGAIGPRGSNGSPFTVALFSFTVRLVKPTVAAVSALPAPSAGARSVVTVSGANLPNTANVLIDDADCDLRTIVAEPDGTGFSQSCTFGPQAGTKLAKVMSASSVAGFVIDDTKALTVGSSQGPTTALFDDFNGTAIDDTKWTIDGWNGTGNKYDNWGGPRVGQVSIGDGLVDFGQVGRISTKNKVIFPGDGSIVIEGRMAGAGAIRDTSVMLVDSVSGDQILMGDTNYAGFGFYALGVGSYKLKEASTIGDPTSPLTLGASTPAFMEYRLTVSGDRIKIERGPTLANITQTGSGTLGRSIAGRTFHVSIGTAWAYYPGTWDWIRVSAVSTASISTGKIPHTGITANQCYAAGSYALVACNSPGAVALNGQQDGHRAGVNAMSYSLVGAYSKEECVKDDVTGLIWEAKTATGLRAASKTYTNGGNGLTTDASGYAAQVNAAALCGFTDWRLPTPVELQGLMNYSIPVLSMHMDSTWFEAFAGSLTTGFMYWTATPWARDAGQAWRGNFDAGGIGPTSRGQSLHVRLVRGASPEAASPTRYTYSTDGSEVTDTHTGLIWRRCTEGLAWNGATCAGAPKSLGLEAALAHAKTQTGWRLPNAKELTTIVDRTRVFPAADPVVFPGTLRAWYWTSTPFIGDGRAFYVDFDEGYTNIVTPSGTSLPIRLVRDR